MSDLLIFGNGEIAKLASTFVENYTKFKVHGFVVDNLDKNSDQFFNNKKIILSKDIDKFPSNKFSMFVALSYRKLNKLRADKFLFFKKKGYKFVNLIHPNNNIGKNVTFGENNFIFENQTIQDNVKIKDNVILWSSNHIGHSSTIESHVYISSHVVISGHVKVGSYSFLGVNSAIADFCSVGKECFVGMGSCINKNLKDGVVSINKSTKFLEADSKLSKIIKKKYFKL